MLSDGRWDYTYDAENRLVAMQTHIALSPSILPNADARRVEFKNDYLGRRVQKTVRAGYNGTAFTSVVSDTVYLYDGWNLLREMNALNGLATVRGYVWGLDWSGSLQGAGGVGGLLHERDAATATSMRPAYDGNGNLMALLSTTDGTSTASYEYDAFGNTLAAYGSHAASNPFRFSTKYTDVETGLVYYGLRYYSPTLGRFINRDPISEQGGLNLYGFCSNNGVNRWDYLGNITQDYYLHNNAMNPDNWLRPGTPFDSGSVTVMGGVGDWNVGGWVVGQRQRNQAFANALLDGVIANVSAVSAAMSAVNVGAIEASWSGGSALAGASASVTPNASSPFTTPSISSPGIGTTYGGPAMTEGGLTVLDPFVVTGNAPVSGATWSVNDPNQAWRFNPNSRTREYNGPANGISAFGTALSEVVEDNGIFQLSVSGGIGVGGYLSVTWNPGQSLTFTGGVGLGLGLGVSLGAGLEHSQANPNYPGFVDPPTITLSVSGGAHLGGELSGSVSLDPYRSLSGSAVVGAGYGAGASLTVNRSITFDTNAGKQKPF